MADEPKDQGDPAAEAASPPPSIVEQPMIEIHQGEDQIIQESWATEDAAAEREQAERVAARTGLLEGEAEIRGKLWAAEDAAAAQREAERQQARTEAQGSIAAETEIRLREWAAEDAAFEQKLAQRKKDRVAIHAAEVVAQRSE